MPDIHCQECIAWSANVRALKLEREQLLAIADRRREQLAALVRALEFDLRATVGLAETMRHLMNAQQLAVLADIRSRLPNAKDDRAGVVPGSASIALLGDNFRTPITSF